MISAPLYDLLKGKKKVFSWTKTTEESFQMLKRAIQNADMLAHPDFGAPFIVGVDASATAVGFYLAQVGEGGVLKYITFGGRTLTDTERRYAVIDKELLGIYYAVKTCYVYLCRNEYIVYTDHKPLTQPFYLRDVHNRRYRWLTYLEECGAKVVYVKGKDNIVADFISRSIPETPVYKMVNSSAIEFYSLLHDIPELIAMQKADKHLGAVIQYLTQSNSTDNRGVNKSYRRCLQRLSINSDGILVYTVAGEERIVAPESSRSEMITLCHSSFLSGHHGVFKTQQRILSRFWWPNMYDDVKEFVNGCELCQRVKPVRKKPGLMCKREWPSMPLDFVSIDFLVDLPRTARNNKHILVVNDHFSKFVRLYPIKDRQAQTAAKFVVDFCLDFGIPRKLLSDQDPAYESLLFKEMMRLLDIKKVRTSGYRPQTNGLTEQSNSTIKRYLTIFLDAHADKDNWDILLKPLAYAYNSSIHTSTRYSPAELMFGRPFRIPTDLLYGQVDGRKFYSLKEFQDNLKYMYGCAREAMLESQDKMKTTYDKKRKHDDLGVGDFVYVFNPKVTNTQLRAKWEGPYPITRKTSTNYEVRGSTRMQWLPRDRLRRYNGNVTNIERDDIETSDNRSRIESDSSSDSSSDISSEESDNDDIVAADGPRYGLRARPTQQPDRLVVSQINFV